MRTPPAGGKEPPPACSSVDIVGSAALESYSVMKKGPWTAEEDAILIDYVKQHGEGNWNAVSKSSSLRRCGKSCRLRWANHLRPNLKKGSFSPEEEAIIILLHSQIGNKWARMAAQLPGRTDNEIKNYWNTRIKRRQRAGLPMYPPEIRLPEMQGKPCFFPASFSPPTTVLAVNPLSSRNPLGSPRDITGNSFQFPVTTVSPSPAPANYTSIGQFLPANCFTLDAPLPLLPSPAYGMNVELSSSQLFRVTAGSNGTATAAEAPAPDPKLPDLDSCIEIEEKKSVTETPPPATTVSIVEQEISTLQDMIPAKMTAPVPAPAVHDWYSFRRDGTAELLNGPSSAASDELGAEIRQMPPANPAATAGVHLLGFSSCSWDNMPSIL